MKQEFLKQYSIIYLMSLANILKLKVSHQFAYLLLTVFEMPIVLIESSHGASMAVRVAVSLRGRSGAAG